MTHSTLSHLECSTTGARRDAGLMQTVSSPAGETPLAGYGPNGVAAAVTLARAHGATELAAPSAGNAAVALAAYSARADLEAHLATPRDTPPGIARSGYLLGDEVTLVDGSIDDAARIVGELDPPCGCFDVSTLREPYRVEGEKTMALEAEASARLAVPGRRVLPDRRRARCGLGFMAGPESGAAMAPLGRLRATGAVRNDELVVLGYTDSDLP